MTNESGGIGAAPEPSSGGRWEAAGELGYCTLSDCWRILESYVVMGFQLGFLVEEVCLYHWVFYCIVVLNVNAS